MNLFFNKGKQHQYLFKAYSREEVQDFPRRRAEQGGTAQWHQQMPTFLVGWRLLFCRSCYVEKVPEGTHRTKKSLELPRFELGFCAPVAPLLRYVVYSYRTKFSAREH